MQLAVLKEQVLFYISGRGSARYHITTKWIITADSFLWNSARLKHKVTLYKNPEGCRYKVQRSSTCSTHAHASWAPPQAVQAKRGLQKGLLSQLQPGTYFCPCPSQLGPADHLMLYVKPAPRHPFLPLFKVGRHGEEVNSSTLSALIHAKSFTFWKGCLYLISLHER